MSTENDKKIDLIFDRPVLKVCVQMLRVAVIHIKYSRSFFAFAPPVSR
jgi:hypothetical protein